MALTASDIIDAARDFAATNTEHQIPDKVLLRHLSRIQRGLYQRVSAEDEVALAVSEVVSEAEITTALDDGTALPLAADVLMFVDGTVHYSTFPEWPDTPFFLVPVRLKDEMWHLRPSGYLLGQSVYLRRFPRLDDEEDEWTDAETLTVRYVPLPAQLTALADTLEIPDVAENALVYALAEAMLVIAREDATHMGSMAESATTHLIDLLTTQDSTTSDRVRLV